ncbi:MAG: tripartite tricarboxylate transporter substrate-binding protein, partial [Burkholderiales bacterium]
MPFAPGGSTDIIARSIGQKLTERWSQPVLVDNKAGAATTLGTDFVAKSKPDGYTILLAPVPFVFAQYLYPKLGYDS